MSDIARSPRPATDRQREILDLIVDLQRSSGRFPTLREIADRAGVCTNMAQCFVRCLERKGFLGSGDRCHARSRRIILPGGTIPCGECLGPLPVPIPDRSDPDERPELTNRQAKLLGFIRSYALAHGRSPVFREMKADLGVVSTNGVEAILKSLVRKGYVSKPAILPSGRGQARSLRLLPAPGSRSCPVCGRPDALPEPAVPVNNG